MGIEDMPEKPDGGDVEDIRRQMRKRLSAAVSRRTSAPPARPDGPGAIFYRRDLPPPKPASAPRPAGPRVELTDAIRGVNTSVPGGGSVFVVDTPVGRADEFAGLCDSFRRSVTEAASPLRRHMAKLALADELQPRDVLFLDLETTGLSSGPLFLIGTMRWEADGLVVRQYFARDYAEERPAVAMFLEAAADAKLLVSFNGKSFDAPYVRVRAAATGVPCSLDLPHLDLLHLGRRVWGRGLSDCKLQTLERVICGRGRTGDIPGHLIPQAYHDYVRTGNAIHMIDCLKHNMLDLVTLADLMTRLAPPEA